MPTITIKTMWILLVAILWLVIHYLMKIEGESCSCISSESQEQQ